MRKREKTIKTETHSKIHFTDPYKTNLIMQRTVFQMYFNNIDNYFNSYTFTKKKKKKLKKTFSQVSEKKWK